MNHVSSKIRNDLGVARQVLCILREEKLKLPTRSWSGPRRGQLVWKDAAFSAVMRILSNPVYSGAYVYGQGDYSGSQRSSKSGKAKISFRQIKDWPICIIGHHEGYITWDEYVENRRKLHQNWFRSMTRGAPRRGPALLQGLVICGQCGAKMQVNSYSARERRRASYLCTRSYSERGDEHICQSMSSKPIDEVVSTLFIEALSPAQMEIATKVAFQVKREKAEVRHQWERQITQAKYEAHLAERQYYSVDPDYRQVASELERRWNEKLEALKAIEESYATAERKAHFSVTPEEERAVRTLARDLPQIWNAASTENKERKQLLRYAIDNVQLDGVSTPGKIEIRVTWRSGGVTVRTVDRLAVGSWAPRTSETVVKQIRELAPTSGPGKIARRLNDAGLRSAHGRTFTYQHVLYIARSRGISLHGHHCRGHNSHMRKKSGKEELSQSNR